MWSNDNSSRRCATRDALEMLKCFMLTKLARQNRYEKQKDYLKSRKSAAPEVKMPDVST